MRINIFSLAMFACLLLMPCSAIREKERNLDSFHKLQRDILAGKAPMRVSFNCLAGSVYLY